MLPKIAIVMIVRFSNISGKILVAINDFAFQLFALNHPSLTYKIK